MADKYWRRGHRQGITLGNVDVITNGPAIYHTDKLHHVVTFTGKGEQETESDPRAPGEGFLGKMFNK